MNNVYNVDSTSIRFYVLDLSMSLTYFFCLYNSLRLNLSVIQARAQLFTDCKRVLLNNKSCNEYNCRKVPINIQPRNRHKCHCTALLPFLKTILQNNNFLVRNRILRSEENNLVGDWRAAALEQHLHKFYRDNVISSNKCWGPVTSRHGMDEDGAE